MLNVINWVVASRPQPPVPAVLLAFANDWLDDKRHLRSLLEEGKAISKALAPAVRAGLDVLAPVHNATVSDVIEAFREHHEQIRIFHFAGHASGSALVFEDEGGRPAEAHASGLAGYLGRQSGLVLVFLNGCCTAPQVRQLRNAGVKAVVATTHLVQDAVAAELARTFYAELAVRPLRSAFETAVHALQARLGEDARGATRDAVPPGESQAISSPWVIDCDPRYETWTLASELARKPDRARWRQLCFSIAVVLFPLFLSRVLSAGARRTTCRAPGVRLLCELIGTGDVPTVKEQALWEAGLKQQTGEGLQDYLRAYPTGFHADEARARLAACAHVRVETLGPERSARYPLTVNAIYTDPQATEQDARNDALARGTEDAVTSCELLKYTAQVLSASVEPRRWRCTEEADRFTCGFDGDVVCRVRDRIATDQQLCRSGIRPDSEPAVPRNRDP